MLYTKIQPQSFLDSEKIFKYLFLPHIGMAAILFSGVKCRFCVTQKNQASLIFPKRPRTCISYYYYHLEKIKLCLFFLGDSDTPSFPLLLLIRSSYFLIPEKAIREVCFAFKGGSDPSPLQERPDPQSSSRAAQSPPFRPTRSPVFFKNDFKIFSCINVHKIGCLIAV